MNRPDADDVTTTKWSLKPVFNICTTILTKVSDRKPGAFTLAPKVTDLRHSWGTKTSSPLDGDKFTDFWVDLMKILFFGKIWYFHSMDFLDGVKGQNSKNICINVTFSYTICEKWLFFTFFTFWGENMTFWGWWNILSTFL